MVLLPTRYDHPGQRGRCHNNVQGDHGLEKENRTVGGGVGGGDSTKCGGYRLGQFHHPQRCAYLSLLYNRSCLVGEGGA